MTHLPEGTAPNVKNKSHSITAKVVIPDDSSLSYNEAWDFTKTVLTEFDYYYIDGWD